MPTNCVSGCCGLAVRGSSVPSVRANLIQVLLIQATVSKFPDEPEEYSEQRSMCPNDSVGSNMERLLWTKGRLAKCKAINFRVTDAFG